METSTKALMVVGLLAWGTANAQVENQKMSVQEADRNFDRLSTTLRAVNRNQKLKDLLRKNREEIVLGDSLERQAVGPRPIEHNVFPLKLVLTADGVRERGIKDGHYTDTRGDRQETKQQYDKPITTNKLLNTMGFGPQKWSRRLTSSQVRSAVRGYLRAKGQ